jgi:hypothetical protein
MPRIARINQLLEYRTQTRPVGFPAATGSQTKSKSVETHFSQVFPAAILSQALKTEDAAPR